MRWKLPITTQGCAVCAPGITCHDTFSQKGVEWVEMGAQCSGGELGSSPGKSGQQCPRLSAAGPVTQ